MATKVGTAYLPVEGDFRKFDKDLGDALKKSKSRFAGLAHSITHGAGLAAGAIAGGIVLELKHAVGEYTDAQKIAKQTNAVIKSTGDVSGVTAKHVSALATSLSRKTGADDDAIQSSENLLLTFTNLRNEAGKGNKIFDRSTALVQDMSVALGQDAKSSAIQLGKALNDPVKGVTALQRVGVSFTAQQKDQIKTLVASGKTLQAQKLVLREINREFGGSAAAQAQPLDRLKVSIGNLQEAIGSGFKPVVDELGGRLDKLAVRELPAVQRAADDLSRVFARKDLSLGDKLSLSEQDVRRDLSPAIAEIKRQIGGAHLGDEAGKAITDIAPKIADAMAAEAPHAAGAFIHAFEKAGPGGQLLTVGLLASKLGAFQAVGKIAARRFATTIAAEAATGQAAESLATAGRRGGRAYGRAFGPAAGLTIGVALASYLQSLPFIRSLEQSIADKITGGHGITDQQLNRTLARRQGQIHRQDYKDRPIHGGPLADALAHPDRSPHPVHRRAQLAYPHAPSGRTFRGTTYIDNRTMNVNVTTPGSGAPDGRHLLAQLDLVAASKG